MATFLTIFLTAFLGAFFATFLTAVLAIFFEAFFATFLTTYDLAPELILAMIFTESRFDIYAESEAGAIGLMQLRPATARAVAEKLEMDWKGQRLLTDPQINILLGTSYLRSLLNRYNEHGLDYALAAYNIGPTKFDALLAERGRAPAQYARQVRQLSEDLRDEFFYPENHD